MLFDTDDIARITSEACAMFGMAAVDPTDHDGEIELSGSIRIDGSWKGSVAMGCSQAFARKLAALMFEMDDAELDPELVHDAFGELVNVTTGNIKALLPAGCSMGIPQVADFDSSVGGADTHVQLWGFQADGDHLTVVIQAA